MSPYTDAVDRAVVARVAVGDIYSDDRARTPRHLRVLSLGEGAEPVATCEPVARCGVWWPVDGAPQQTVPLAYLASGRGYTRVWGAA